MDIWQCLQCRKRLVSVSVCRIIGDTCNTEQDWCWCKWVFGNACNAEKDWCQRVFAGSFVTPATQNKICVAGITDDPANTLWHQSFSVLWTLPNTQFTPTPILFCVAGITDDPANTHWHQSFSLLWTLPNTHLHYQQSCSLLQASLIILPTMAPIFFCIFNFFQKVHIYTTTDFVLCHRCYRFCQSFYNTIANTGLSFIKLHKFAKHPFTPIFFFAAGVTNDPAGSAWDRPGHLSLQLPARPQRPHPSRHQRQLLRAQCLHAGTQDSHAARSPTKGLMAWSYETDGVKLRVWYSLERLQ